MKKSLAFLLTSLERQAVELKVKIGRDVERREVGAHFDEVGPADNGAINARYQHNVGPNVRLAIAHSGRQRHGASAHELFDAVTVEIWQAPRQRQIHQGHVMVKTPYLSARRRFYDGHETIFANDQAIANAVAVDVDQAAVVRRRPGEKRPTPELCAALGLEGDETENVVVVIGKSADEDRIVFLSRWKTHDFQSAG